MEQQGYDANFVHPLLKRHKCPICLFAMRNPVQTECGHLFCRDCLKPVLERLHPVCPLDREDISRDGIYPDNACKREILNLEVNCNFASGGCTWAGHLKELENHVETCHYREIQCKQCGQYIQSRILQVHQDKECPMRPVPCPHCGKDIPHQQMEDHIEKKCPDVLHACPNGCNPALKMKLPELEQHIAEKLGTCPLAKIPCPYYSYGCTFVSMRKDMEVHIAQYQIYHCQILAESYQELKRENQELKRTVSENSASVCRLLDRADNLEFRTSAVENIQDRIYRETITSRQFFGSGGASNVAAAGGGGGGGASNVPISLGGGRIGMLTNGAPSDSSSSLGLGGDPFSIVPQQAKTLTSCVAELERGVDSLSSSLERELRVQLLQTASYNGIFLWRIDDFQRRRREAMEGRIVSLYSPPFYTSRHGYKMCARIYLSGDGLGRNTHMSFFLVIMRGPSDELLSWPFKQKVTLTLVNQMGQGHVTETFRPDPHSSSFQRPGRREMNIASGCPQFIRQEHLVNGGFVKDDCIYIRVMVDTSDLPRVPL